MRGLCCHIRLAVEQAHAERIGHGVDIMYEDRPTELLKEMAAKHILVEINLTSNDADPRRQQQGRRSVACSAGNLARSGCALYRR